MKIEQLTAKILEQNPSLDRYQLALAVAKRCDELENGATSKLSINTNTIKSSDLALMEIAEGLVVIQGFTKSQK